MKLKTKLTSGLGFLFIIIFTLIIFCMYYINKISKDSENILKDNYNSVIYAKNMSKALDLMNIEMIYTSLNQEKQEFENNQNIINEFTAAKNEFENNLNLEKANITEIHEQEYVENLNKYFYIYSEYFQKLNNKKSFENSNFLLEYKLCRNLIDSIYEVNMNSIVKKNQFAKRDAENNIMYMVILGSICLILAFFYFWYFPFYVSNSISILSDKIKKLLKKAGINKEIEANDESFIILESIILLEKKLDKK